MTTTTTIIGHINEEPAPDEDKKVEKICQNLPELVPGLVNFSKTDGDEEKNDKIDQKQGHSLPQIIAATGANMGSFAYGLTICWSATAIPSMKRDADFGNVGDAEYSWITSIVTLGSLAVCLPAGILVDRIGRRKMMLWSSPPFAVGYLLIYFAQNVSMVLAGRFLVGLCSGVFQFAAPIYIAETSEPRIRGKLLSAGDYIATFAVLVELIVGGYLSWRYQALMCSTVPIFIFLILIFVPESPRFLLGKGRKGEASKSLCWLRGTVEGSHIFVKEMNEINENIEESKRNMAANNYCFQEFWRPEVRKAIIIGLILFLFKVFTGMIAVLFYRIEILESAKIDLDEHLSSIILGIVNFVASMCSAAVVDRFGRKFLLISSEVWMGLSLVVLGGFFHVMKMDHVFARESLGWLPLASLVSFIGGYSLGMGALPSSVVTEILPQRVRGVSSSFLTAFRWIMSFLVAHFFNDLMLTLGHDGGYWFFATCCLSGAVYIFCCVPETKGKSLEEIQRGFLKKKNPQSL